MEGISLEPTLSGEKGENSFGIPQQKDPNAPQAVAQQDEKPEDIQPVRINKDHKTSPILIDDAPKEAVKAVG